MQATTPPTAASDTALLRALNPAPQLAQSPVVLIIDDDATARLALAAMMHSDEYRIAFSTDAGEVRHRLAEIAPDVIICDLVMEGMRGDEFFRWVKSHERWKFVPVIAVTRLDNTIVRADLLDAGADMVLLKSTAPREFRAYVAAVLRRRRIDLQLAERRAAG